MKIECFGAFEKPKICSVTCPNDFVSSVGRGSLPYDFRQKVLRSEHFVHNNLNLVTDLRPDMNPRGTLRLRRSSRINVRFSFRPEDNGALPFEKLIIEAASFCHHSAFVTATHPDKDR